MSRNVLDDKRQSDAGRSILVLVVEDEPEVRALASDALSDQGYRVVSVGHATSFTYPKPVPGSRSGPRLVCHEMAVRFPESPVVRRMRLAEPRGVRHLIVGVLTGMLAVGILTAPASAAGSAMTRPSQLTPPPLPTGALPLGSVSGGQQVTFEVVLAPRDTQGLNALLAGLYNPSSAEYHQWLAPGAFDAQFGPSSATVDATLAWLHRLGFQTHVGTGFTVEATGSASDVGSALGVSFERYRLSGGRAVFATSDTPQVPSVLSPLISSIVGLNNVPAETPLLTQVPKGKLSRPGLGSVPAVGAEAPQAQPACAAASDLANQNGGYTPAALGAAYEVPSLVSAGFSVCEIS